MHILRSSPYQAGKGHVQVSKLRKRPGRQVHPVPGPGCVVQMPRVRVPGTLGGLHMGTVAIKFRVMPEGPEVDMAALEMSIKEIVSSNGAELHAVEVKPFAFGLMAMEMAITMPDAGGSISDVIEEAIDGIDGVQSVEVLEVGLL